VSLALGSSTQRSPSGDSPANKKLFVGGLSVKVGEIPLRKYFEQFGEIERLVIVKDQGVSKGYGFVTFKDPKDAQRATQGRHYLGDKSFSCTYLLTEKQAKKQTLADKERKLFLKNLSFNTREQTIKAYFERFGAVERVTINRNLDETSKGSGFVLFEESSAARSLLKHKLAHQIDGRSVKVYATLTKQEIKEYSAKLEQGQHPSPVSVKNDLVNLVHRNSQASAVTFSSHDESGRCSSEFQTNNYLAHGKKSKTPQDSRIKVPRFVASTNSIQYTKAQQRHSDPKHSHERLVSPNVLVEKDGSRRLCEPHADASAMEYTWRDPRSQAALIRESRMGSQKALTSSAGAYCSCCFSSKRTSPHLAEFSALCLSCKANFEVKKAHTEDSSNLVFRVLPHRVTATRRADPYLA
jgi:RNA recognition motif-containing protein